MMPRFSLQLPMSRNIAPLRDLPISSKFWYKDRKLRYRDILNLGKKLENNVHYNRFRIPIFRDSLCEREETDARVRINLLFLYKFSYEFLLHAAMMRFQSPRIQTSYASACTRKICALSSSSSDIPVCCLKKVRSSSVKSYKLSSKVSLSGVEVFSDMTRAYNWTVPTAGSYKYRRGANRSYRAVIVPASAAHHSLGGLDLPATIWKPKELMWWKYSLDWLITFNA